jgi:hypothetical protein
MARPNEHLVDLGSNEVNLNDTKYLAKLPLGGPQEFFTAAKAYLHRHLSQDWQFIENTEPEFDAWKGYFADKGWKLKFMANERKVTMPTRRPQEFDPQYHKGTESFWDMAFRR